MRLRIRKTDKTGYGPVSALFVTFGIYFGSQLFAGLLLGLYIAITGQGVDQASRMLEQSAVGQFVFIAIIELVTMLLLWLFIRRRSISWSFFGVKKPSVTKMFYAIPAFVVYFILLAFGFGLLRMVLPEIDFDQKQQIGFEGTRGLALILVFVSLVVFPAIVEEVLVRGFLYTGLRQKMNKVISALVVSVVFGIAHLQLGSGHPPLWTAAVDTFLLSMVLIWLREKTGTIWAGVLVHMTKNFLAFLSLFILVSR